MNFFDALINMATAPAEAAAAGGSLNAFGRAAQAGIGIATGLQTAKAAGFAADQIRAGGNDAMAAAERQAIGLDQRTQMITSRALAVAAASGGGASDPTVMNLIAGIAEEGAYRKASILYGGKDEQQRAELRAAATEYEGKQARTNSLLNAAGGILGASTTLAKGQAQSSLLTRFGGDGPSRMSADRTRDTTDYGGGW